MSLLLGIPDVQAQSSGEGAGWRAGLRTSQPQEAVRRESRVTKIKTLSQVLGEPAI